MSSSRTNATPLSGAFSVVPQTTHPAPAPRAQPRQFIPPSLFKFIPPSLDIKSHTDRSHFKFPGPRHIRYGTKVSGVPMAQLLSRSGRPANLEVLHRMIPDFEDHTILETGLRDVELKICWPGYRHLQFSRTIFLDPRRGRGVTCKGELAMKVAEAYYEFLMYAPCYQPREAVAGSPRPLVITPNGPFTIDNLALTLLTHVDRGVFEALVEYIPPPPVVGYYIPGLLLDLPQQCFIERTTFPPGGFEFSTSELLDRRRGRSPRASPVVKYVARKTPECDGHRYQNM